MSYNNIIATIKIWTLPIDAIRVNRVVGKCMTDENVQQWIFDDYCFCPSRRLMFAPIEWHCTEQLPLETTFYS